MNKRFASFLLTGKVAALPLFAQESLGAIHESLDAKSANVIRPLAHERDKTLILPHKFIESRMPQIMNLVINGLHDKDEVLIIISPEKDTAKLLENNTDVLSIPNSVILNRFSVSTSNYISQTIFDKQYKRNVSPSNRAVRPISLPVDLNSIPDLSRDMSKSYLHILVVPHSSSDKSMIRYTDVIELRQIDKSTLLSQYTEDCTVYSCP
jgi:hypothetical protein